MERLPASLSIPGQGVRLTLPGVLLPNAAEASSPSERLLGFAFDERSPEVAALLSSLAGLEPPPEDASLWFKRCWCSLDAGRRAALRIFLHDLATSDTSGQGLAVHDNLLSDPNAPGLRLKRLMTLVTDIYPGSDDAPFASLERAVRSYMDGGQFVEHLARDIPVPVERIGSELSRLIPRNVVENWLLPHEDRPEERDVVLVKDLISGLFRDRPIARRIARERIVSRVSLTGGRPPTLAAPGNVTWAAPSADIDDRISSSITGEDLVRAMGLFLGGEGVEVRYPTKVVARPRKPNAVHAGASWLFRISPREDALGKTCGTELTPGLGEIVHEPVEISDVLTEKESRFFSVPSSSLHPRIIS